jgi:predicted transcriptional regulator
MRSACALLVVASTLVVACTGPEEGPAVATGELDPGRPLPSPLPDVVGRVNGQPIRLAQILPMARRVMVDIPADERDSSRPLALRRGLERYIDREVLFQEARARGLDADQKVLDWAYDQARREHVDEEAWKETLAEQGLDPQSYRVELRIQHTVNALLEAEAGLPVGEDEVHRAFDENPSAFAPPGQPPPSFEDVRDDVTAIVTQRRIENTSRELVEDLRARARIETFL